MEFFIEIFKSATEMMGKLIIVVSLGVPGTFYLYNLFMWGWVATLNGMLIAIWPYIVTSALIMYSAWLTGWIASKIAGSINLPSFGSNSTVASV